MRKIPYPGLNPFSEKDTPFFFGRDQQKRAIARSLRISRLTLLFGESGVGKSSILQAGVVPLFRRDAEQNWQDSGKPQLAVVVFRDWHGKNPLQDLLEKIRASVAEAMGIKANDLKDEPKPAESLQVWTKILGREEGRGQLFLILEQFEEYFQSHPQESGEGTFADEFPRWVNRSDLRVNFLISIRQNALTKLHRFQDRILNIFDNQIELKRLDRSPGRDAIVKPIGEYNLRQIVADHLQTSRLTVLSAASGMGKSRLLRVIADNLRGAITFRFWRGNPVVDLVKKVEAELKTLFLDISAPEPGTSLTETLQGWTERISGEGGNSQLFIILDQFEEFFQYQPPEMGEGSFVAEFARAVNHPELPVHFLISIRDEARDLLKHFQDQIPNINIFEHLLQIKQLGKNPEIPDLVKPIEEPDQKLSKTIDIEPKLFEEVLNQLCALSPLDLIGTAGNRISRPSTSQKNVEIEAPLLQLVMERLWTEEVEQKRSHCLRLKTLNDLSFPEKNITGAQRIANDHLSDQMKALSSDRQRDAIAIVFKYLVSAGGTKIAYPILDLPEPTKLDQTELLSVLEQLDAQRILRTVKIPNQPEVSYEIFHDILAWPILNWRDRYLLDKTLKEGKQKARKRILIGSLIGLGLGVALAGLISYDFYVDQQDKKIQEAIHEMKEAEKIFESQPRVSGQIAGLIIAMQAGWQLSESLKDKLLPWNLTLREPIKKYKKDSISNLQEMLNKIREKNILKVANAPIWSVSFSPDGQMLAVGSKDGKLSLWNLQGEKEREFPVSQSAILSVNFSPDGQMLAVGSEDGKLSLWNLQEGKKEKEFSVSQSAIWSVSFSPDGQMLAVGSEDGKLSLWNLQEGKIEREFSVSQSLILSVNFSPDGQMLAVVSKDGSVILWNLQEGKIEREFSVSQSAIWSVSFSPDGQMLAVGSENGSVILWNLQEGKKERVFSVSQSAIWSVNFSRDGQMLAVGSEDGKLSLWNLQGEKLEEFLNFQSSVPANDISFSSKKILATGSKDGTVRLWDIGEKPQIDNNDLNKLLVSGCEWLDDYLKTNPDDPNVSVKNFCDSLKK